jgi:hypothetical protein
MGNATLLVVHQTIPARDTSDMSRRLGVSKKNDYIPGIKRSSRIRHLEDTRDFLVLATFAEPMTPTLHKIRNGATGRDASTLTRLRPIQWLNPHADLDSRFAHGPTSQSSTRNDLSSFPRRT